MHQVNRHELLAKLKRNLSTHRSEFLEAQKGYRAKVIEELDHMLAEARANQPIRRALSLPEPQDHTADYEMVIAMLEMSTETELVIHAQQFRNYVMDDWEWTELFKATNLRYK